MSLQNTMKKRYMYARIIKESRGGSWIRYYLDASYCHYAHGASPENYFVLRFFDMDDSQRAEYLTSGRSKEMDRRLNEEASPKDKKITGNKYRFNQVFSCINRRGFLYAPNVSRQEFAEFVSRHGRVIVKPVGQSRGIGIHAVDTADIEDMAGFFARCRDCRCLLEEPLVQHPAVAAIHRESVNTIRIVAARDSKRAVRLIGAAMRCGTGESMVDNFHGGGIAYPVDLEQGIITGPGRDNMTLKEYTRHPGTGYDMKGFAVPGWGKILEAVYAGMGLVPTLGYVGWDIAVTLYGAEIIEGNYNWPGGNIIQFDNIGKYAAVKECTGYEEDKA